MAADIGWSMRTTNSVGARVRSVAGIVRRLEAIACDRCSGISTAPDSASASMRRISLASCRTLPGQLYRIRYSIVSSATRMLFLCDSRLYLSRKCCTSGGISSRRSRSGGTCEADDVEAVEEVFAEATVGDQLLEVGVGGGDDANVDVDRAWLAERVDFAGLEKAQQLGLDVERDLADLVEEERAAGGARG